MLWVTCQWLFLELRSNTVRRSNETNDTLCFKGKWLQRETKTNSLGTTVITFKTVPIYSVNIYSHFFTNKYAFPHLSFCHARTHSSFFFHIWSFFYLLFLWNYIWKWCINTSCFSQLEKSPCSIVFLINTFLLVGIVGRMRGDLRF